MRWLVTLVLAVGAVSVLPAPAAGAASAKVPDRAVTLSRWAGGDAFRTGERAGVRVRHGALLLDEAPAHRSYGGTRYDVGTWTSPWARPFRCG